MLNGEDGWISREPSMPLCVHMGWIVSRAVRMEGTQGAANAKACRSQKISVSSLFANPSAFRL